MAITADDFALRARRLRWLLCDVDGVLTDGRILYGASGEPMASFDIKDGLALKIAQKAGLRVGLISGRASQAVAARAAELGLDAAVLGRLDKGRALDELLAAHGAVESEVAFIGDDLPDLAPLRRCGLAFAPNDAVAEVLAEVHRPLTRPGGHGAVREAVELILQARGDWPRIVASYFA